MSNGHNPVVLYVRKIHYIEFFVFDIISVCGRTQFGIGCTAVYQARIAAGYRTISCNTDTIFVNSNVRSSLYRNLVIGTNNDASSCNIRRTTHIQHIIYFLHG